MVNGILLLQTHGEIVVFNQEWVNYHISGRYRVFGAQRAAAVGAVATLIRSATPFSINSPHRGMQVFIPFQASTHNVFLLIY